MKNITVSSMKSVDKKICLLIRYLVTLLGYETRFITN